MREHGAIATASGETIVVRSETDGSLGLLVGRSGMYLLASLTLAEAADLRAALTLAIRDVGHGERSRTLLEEEGGRHGDESTQS